MSTKLSICTPTWNRERFLEKSVRETIEQIDRDDLWNNVEICLSDNGSTDKTPEIIDSLKSEFPRVTIRSNRFESNQGFAANMDAVIRLASGEFIFLNGDDDLFQPSGVKRLLDHCSTIDRPIVLIKNLRDYGGVIDWETLKVNQTVIFEDTFAALNVLGAFHPTFIGNFILRKDAYLKHFNPIFLQSIYPHTAIVFEVLRGCQVELRNFTCVDVDDSDRHIGNCSARGTAVDVARIQTEGHLLNCNRRNEVFRFYKLFLRSVPRAVLNWRSGLCKSRAGRYADLSLTNLLGAYRASYRAMLIAAVLYLVARSSPQWLLRRVLR